MSTLSIGGHQVLPDVKSGNGTINTAAFTTDSSSYCAWRIVNGVCLVSFGRITPKASGAGQTLITGLPACKLYTSYMATNASYTVCGTGAIANNTGTMAYSTSNTNMFWGSFSYPVE